MRLEVSCEDRLGLTRELLDRLVEHNIDLRGIEIDTSGIIYLNFPELEFRDFQHLMPEIRRIPGVGDAQQFDDAHILLPSTGLVELAACPFAPCGSRLD